VSVDHVNPLFRLIPLRLHLTLSSVSKAFTRESDDSRADEFPLLRRQIPPGTRNLITREGAARLRLRLESLLQMRDGFTTTSAEACSDHQVQRRKIEQSIRNLQDVLDSLVITEPPIAQTKVGFGATVAIRYADEQEETFRIVGLDEADPDHNAISWLSPFAKALLARRAGDRVQFREQELTILSVSY
jgi:transcription elongation factor GreB